MKELLQKLDNLRQITSPQDWESIAGLFDGHTWADVLFAATVNQDATDAKVAAWCETHNIAFGQ